jgi:hemerythrin-like domain-containing protein
MLQEHAMGRTLVGHMKNALPKARGGDGEARKILVNSGRGYIQLIRAHILKEDNVLFNFADQTVTGAACEKLCQAYGVVCQRRFEGHSKEELEALAEGLAERYGGG